MAVAQSAPENGTETKDFDTIVEKYGDFVYNVAFKMMGKPEDAEDVAQDAFLSAYRAFDRFRGEGARDHMVIQDYGQRGPHEAKKREMCPCPYPDRSRGC